MAVLSPDTIFKKEAMQNNTFDIDVLEKTLGDIENLEYNNMLTAQRNLAGWYKFNFNKFDIKYLGMYNGNYIDSKVIKIPEDFIDHHERKQYRLSEFYGKPLTRLTIADNSHIFSKNWLLFKDGRLVDIEDSTYILCNEDVTYLVLDPAHYDGLEMTIFFIPNSELGVFAFNNTKTPDTDNTKVLKYTNRDINTLSLKPVTDDSYTVTDNLYSYEANTHSLEILGNESFIHNYRAINQPSSVNIGKKISYRRDLLFFEDGYMKMGYKKSNSDNDYGFKLDFHHINKNTISNKKYEYVTLHDIVIMNESIVKYSNTDDGGEAWLRPTLYLQEHLKDKSIKPEDIIIDESNILAFKQNKEDNGDVYYTFMHNLEIISYYPNIFKVNINDNSMIGNYIFLIRYHVRNDLFDFRMNDFQLLRHDKLFPFKPNITKQMEDYHYQWFSRNNSKAFKYNNDQLGKDPLLEFYRNAYKNDTHRELLNYKSYDIEYHHKDYWDNSGLFNDDLKYKIYKLKTLIKDNNWLLSIYNHNLNFENDSYYIDISNLNLERRLRNNVSEEISGNTQVFNKPHYVFKFNRDITTDIYQLRIFIDGLLFIPEYVYTTKEHIIFYIPNDKIKADSMMEIERLYQYVKRFNHTFTQLINNVEFDVSDRYVRINTDDICIISGVEYVPRDRYDIEVLYTYENNTEWLSVGKDSLLPVKDKFRVVLKDNAYLNKQLTILVSRKTMLYNRHITNEADIIGIFRVQYDGVNDTRLFRIFKNGRMIPRYIDFVRFTKRYKDTHVATIPVPLEIGDTIQIDALPYKYIEVYYNKDIPENGILDLTNILQRPFDLRWYDIFVNGRKLNIKQVDVLTPVIIQLKNINSLKNVAIYQKNRVIDYFRLNDPTIGYKCPEDLILQYEDLKNKLFTGSITDTEGDLVPKREDIIASNIYEDLYDEILTDTKNFDFRYINPDLQQITDEIKEYYGETLDELLRLKINADISVGSTKFLLLNPDTLEI